jgi:UDP-N-acetylglucosamine--N-acetylmuramyl-(pentapeptide) pyrophosphoryl-undecaprenol N-acetylglucosamine transferase
MGQYKFILSGGGTGGHIYPAIDRLWIKISFPDAEFLFAKDKMEMQKIRKPVFKLGVCGFCGFTKENKFTKFDVSI